MKHTPAPWHSDGVLIWAEDHVIAQADLAGVEYNEEIRQANACLIAAAPRMYDRIVLLASDGDVEAKSILEQINNGIHGEH
jgi:hypothetical protein